MTNIIIGHSTKDPGATDSRNGITEFLYANVVAYHMLDILGAEEINILYRNGSYSELPNHINKHKSNLNICLHLNAANKEAEGGEIISSGSENSMLFAEIMLPKMCEVFGVKSRGIKIRRKGRGSNVLMNTKAPTVILEPFFIDNDNDLELDENKVRKYALAICEAIEEYNEKIKSHEKTI